MPVFKMKTYLLMLYRKNNSKTFRYITMQKDYERMRIYIEELNKEKANLQSQLARNEATSIISNVCFRVRVTFEIILENLIELYL